MLKFVRQTGVIGCERALSADKGAFPNIGSGPTDWVQSENEISDPISGIPILSGPMIGSQSHGSFTFTPETA